jgi:hypothetical protein
VLHAHANSLPHVEIRYQTSFESFEQDAQAVSAKFSTRKPDARKPSARIIWLVAMAVAAVSGALWI